ncbi:MAG TPA: lipid A biosynthesis lauroyl acyltransferase [Bauldia sp.]|nr:lipid A biosynthesis lauroyl acyltransferase [Bauldia sp.]
MRKRGSGFRGRFVRSDFFFKLSAGTLRGGMNLVQRLGRDRALRTVTRLFRMVAPLMPETRMARASIVAAFPEKSEAEREAILRGAWDNFAMVVVEFLFLAELAGEFDPARPNEGKVTVAGLDHFVALRDDGKPAVLIAAHLANWEILGVVAHKFGLKTVLPFRAPGNVHLADDVLAQREALMGTLVESGRGASFEIAAALDRGEHLGMLVDQRLTRGLDVPFFGRPALTNPLPAKFARAYDCPVHGARAIRLPGGRLHLELTPPIELPRDGEGLIDVEAATVEINRIVEGWVREHPEQWFWLHDRWRH